MIELLLARQITIILAGALSAWTDYKTGYIYDKITYPLIAIGILFNLIEGEFLGIALGAVVFGIGYVLYIAGKFGGGDVKLLAGIAMTLPFFAGKIFVISVLILSAMSAMIFFAVYYMLKYARKGIDFKYNKEGIRNSGILLAAIMFYFYMLITNEFVSVGTALFLIVPVCFGIVFVGFEKGIKKEFFLKKIKLKEIKEEEIIALEFMSKEELEKIKKFGAIITPEDIEKFSKKGIKEILIYYNLPKFGPFILAGIVIALAFPGAWFF